MGSGDSYAQAVQALSNAEAALRNLGREFRCGTHHGLCDEYRGWEEVGRASGEFFGGSVPHRHGRVSWLISTEISSRSKPTP